MEHPEEFERLLNIYNKFEMEELIIHPRVRANFYKNKPNMEVFGQAVKESKNRLCYNGDLFIKSHFEAFEKEYPQVERDVYKRQVHDIVYHLVLTAHNHPIIHRYLREE